MHYNQPQYNKDSGRNTSNQQWHKQPNTQDPERRVDRYGKMLGPYITHKSHIGNIEPRCPPEKKVQKKDTLHGYESSYHSSSPPSPPNWSPPESLVTGSPNNNHHPMYTPITNKNKDQKKRLKRYPSRKNYKKRQLTPNLKRMLQQSSQKMGTLDVKKQKQLKIKKLKQQKVEQETKDQKLVRMAAEVVRLEKSIKVSTIGLENNKLKINNQRRYILEIAVTSRYLKEKNQTMKRLVSSLEDLRRTNKKQKEVIRVMA